MDRQRRSRERVGGWSYSIGGTDGVGRVREVRAEVEMLGNITRPVVSRRLHLQSGAQ
jgi:hypothetical protein